MLARIRKAQEENEGGFTLIELLVVMIIIGILAAIAIPVFLSQREKARDTSTKADVSTVGKEVAAYYVDGTGEVFVAITGGEAIVYEGTDNTGTELTRTAVSAGTAVAGQSGVDTATTWCVAFTNPDGSAGNNNWQYSAAAGLGEGTCA
jgi:type IV pilus assembly protein PilA